MTQRFDGEICGFGTPAGRRVVVGHWASSPLGAFTDVMVEAPDGRRTLLAPTVQVAELVAGIYTFDEAHVVGVRAERTPGSLFVAAGPLHVHIGIGRRDALGWALRAVPRRLAASKGWTVVTDPIARTVLRGVRTRGRTPGGREYYAALDRHRLTSIAGTWEGAPLGALRPVEPPVSFGFGSTPPTPSIVRLVSIVTVGS